MHAIRKACATAGIQVHPTGVCTGDGWFADQPVPQNGLYGYAGTRGLVLCTLVLPGVGEHVAAVRRDTLSGLAGLGVEIDAQRNAQSAKGARRISTGNSPVTVLVVPTDEELAIARDCLQAI
jgi:hypothetical protein